MDLEKSHKVIPLRHYNNLQPNTDAAPTTLYQNASATFAIDQLDVQYSILYIYNVIIQGKALEIPFQREGLYS
jgi:hypothetical protein